MLVHYIIITRVGVVGHLVSLLATLGCRFLRYLLLGRLLLCGLSLVGGFGLCYGLFGRLLGGRLVVVRVL